MAKDTHLKNVLGTQVFQQIRQTKVLLVGAGGIGCELLKDLVLMGYGEIHIVDLDTIDLSNLNRQFLFRHKDIKKPKATTAVNAVQSFNFHGARLVAYMANIMDTAQFPLEWFDQFKFVFNALDNIQARSYVNKMCLFLKKPSIESGTTGFNGQVTPIFPYQTECYECTVKETPKTYPVCTIRSTPSQPVHCVTWAKSYLFGQLFGEHEDSDVDISQNELGTDNKEEIKNLIKEHNELLELKKHLREDSFYEKVIDKIFVKDIEKLLALEDLWRTRARPVPLNWNGELKRKVLALTDQDVARGQDVWPVENYIYLLIKSIKALQKRDDDFLEFDKDDEDTLDFVVAATNIRSSMFHIPLKSKFDIKQIAGNIIPAIATTNSVIAGYSALQSIFMFQRAAKEESRMVYTFQDPTRFMSASALYDANPNCKACSIPRAVLKVNFADDTLTLAAVIDEVVRKLKYEHDEISLILGKDKLVYGADFDDNRNAPLAPLGFRPGEVLLVDDENDEKSSVELYISDLKEESGGGGFRKVYLDEMELPPKPVVEKPTEEEEQQQQQQEKQKRDIASATPVLDGIPIMISDDDDDDEEKVQVQKEEPEPSTKKHKHEDDIEDEPNKKQKKQKTTVESTKDTEDSIVILD